MEKNNVSVKMVRFGEEVRKRKLQLRENNVKEADKLKEVKIRDKVVSTGKDMKAGNIKY